MNRFIAILCLLNCISLPLQAQKKKDDRFFDVHIGPSLGFRILGKYDVPATYKGTSDQYRDSLNKTDRPGQSINLGAQYMWKKSAFNGFSVGLSYTDLSFRRIVTNMTLGYEIHKDVGIIAGVIQAGLLQINYDFHYRHIEIPLLWHRSAEGYGNLRDFDMWYFAGFAPAYMFKDRIEIATQGFTLNGQNRFSVKDDEITGNPFNVIGHLGFRAQYHMYKKIHGLVQPHFRVPILPSSGGAQNLWIPQFSLNLGLVFVLGNGSK